MWYMVYQSFRESSAFLSQTYEIANVDPARPGRPNELAPRVRGICSLRTACCCACSRRPRAVCRPRDGNKGGSSSLVVPARTPETPIQVPVHFRGHLLLVGKAFLARRLPERQGPEGGGRQ